MKTFSPVRHEELERRNAVVDRRSDSRDGGARVGDDAVQRVIQHGFAFCLLALGLDGLDDVLAFRLLRKIDDGRHAAERRRARTHVETVGRGAAEIEIEMDVRVDGARDDELVRRVYHARGRSICARQQSRHFAVANTHIGPERGVGRNDPSTSNEEIERTAPALCAESRRP